MATAQHTGVWTRPDRAAAGPKPRHSRDSIARAAIDVADKDGLEAVSMRSVAAALGSGTASLYRYLKSQDELIEVMIDAVSAEYDLETPSGTAAAKLTDLAFQSRSIMHRHRWLPPLLLTRPALGPNSLRYLEYALSALSGAGIGESAKLRTVAMLTAITAAHALNELSAAGPPAADGSPGEYLATIARSGQYLYLGTALANASPVTDPDETFREVIIGHLAGAGVRDQRCGRHS
ncbi:TetR/AcrR family transcriptional regulator [Arthrobacter castelli]|uniref:TetR/AcrR family transcriptional regulator n=1 Tax=Arthrobacter castelli TaxID=271431 RepID=UPI0003FBFBFC|nr:TetR/AcrR family transcriptional regulator C-terminal domain-containing protein [Arthrobacter castelli]